MAVTGHALNQLLQQMDRTFSNVTGQSVSFIDQEGHYQGPLRLDVFTGFCRRVISSEKGAQHCLACNHSFGLDAEQRCTVSQCHMGISVISVPVPGVTYSSAAVMLTRSNTLEGAAVEAMIRPAEMDRSEPSEGRLMTLTASAPSGRAA